jgi:hypothetical protein
VHHFDVVLVAADAGQLLPAELARHHRLGVAPGVAMAISVTENERKILPKNDENFSQGVFH